MLGGALPKEPRRAVVAAVKDVEVSVECAPAPGGGEEESERAARDKAADVVWREEGLKGRGQFVKDKDYMMRRRSRERC